MNDYYIGDTHHYIVVFQLYSWLLVMWLIFILGDTIIWFILVNVLIDYHHESDESSFICSIGHDSAGTIIGSGAANPGKKVEDDGVPAMANHSPEEPEEKGWKTMGKSWNIMKNNSWWFPPQFFWSSSPKNMVDVWWSMGFTHLWDL